MQDPLLIRSPADADRAGLDPAHAPGLPRRRRVLMADPSHFRIAYAINPHMRSGDGGLQTIAPQTALEQWEGVRDAYAALGYKVETLPADEAHPDLVFTANQAFPYPDPHAESSQGEYCFIPSRMAHPERAGEVPIVAAWLRGEGYRETPLPEDVQGTVEGGGDLLWMGERRILFGGVGPRTTLSGLRAVADRVECPLVVLDLHDPDFYHLDTCLSFLDDRTALWVPNAFKPSAQRLLAHLVENLVEVDDLEARRGLAANGHCPDGRHVIIHPDNPRTTAALENLGYDVVECDTSEFNKSGGSVFCLKMMLW